MERVVESQKKHLAHEWCSYDYETDYRMKTNAQLLQLLLKD